MATFEFDRYINGVLMAEGVTIERQPNLECAMRVAAHIASRGPNGEAPVLVLRTPQPAAQPGVVKEAVRRELADAISYLVDLAGAKPTPMSPQNCRIHIDHARMSARNLAALAAPVSQEPVAWQAFCVRSGGQMVHTIKSRLIDRADSLYGKNQWRLTPLYSSPQPLTEGEPSEAGVERVFTRWWDASKYRQVIFAGEDYRQVAFDAWRAALLAAKSKGGHGGDDA